MGSRFAVKKVLLLALFLSISFLMPGLVWAGKSSERSYLGAMRYDLVRGLKNVAGAVVEIPVALQEYHEQAGYTMVRHLQGLVDGTFRAITRMGSGLWDFPAAFLPGCQDGLPADPETRF